MVQQLRSNIHNSYFELPIRQQTPPNNTDNLDSTYSALLVRVRVREGTLLLLRGIIIIAA